MLDTRKLEQMLRQGLQELSISLTDQQLAQQIRYIEELNRWNKAYNLTAIRDPEQMLYLHTLDSLAILPLLEGENFVDVGTGPGIPGIPLAIACPEKRFQLIDSNGKKMRFVFQTRTAMKLDNVVENQVRVEQFAVPDGGYCGVISRAFTSIPDMLEKCDHLVSDNGYFYAMKGKLPEDELSNLPKNYKVVSLHQLTVPGVEAERHLIQIAKDQ